MLNITRHATRDSRAIESVLGVMLDPRARSVGHGPPRILSYLDFLDAFLGFFAGFLSPLAVGDFLPAGILSPPFLVVAASHRDLPVPSPWRW